MTTSGFLAIVILCFGYAVCEFRLQILHNNDLHARFAETDSYGASCPPDYAANNKCFGGFARNRQAAFDAIEEAKKQNISSIFLNAGDAFQGTPYYSLYKWKIVAPLMDSLRANVMCLGNHEFDDGIDNLVEYINNVKTPIVACNLNLSSEARLKLPNLMPSTVLDVDGVKIGVIGYLTPETMVTSNTENLQIFDEIPKIREEAKRLKADGIKIIIALGHSGFQRDQEIAKEVEEISVVVGGHSHTLLYTPKDDPPSTEKAEGVYPFMVTQKSGKQVPIVQAYAYSKYLGKLMVTFDDDGNVITANGNPQVLDYSVKKDPEVEHLVESWSALVREKLSVVKGYTRVFVKKSDFTTSEFESNAGNLITDSLIYGSVLHAHKTNSTQWTRASISLYQSGGIRSKMDNQKSEGAITLEDILTFLPFQNKLFACRLPGFALRQAVEFSVSTYDAKKSYSYINYFLNYSGLKVIYNLKNEPGSRTESIMVLCKNCTIPKYEPLDENKIYDVIMNEFLKRGGDNFDMFPKNIISCEHLKLSETDSVVTYVENHKVIYPILDGRIVVKGFKEQSSAASRTKVSFYLLFLVSIAISLCNQF